MSDLADDADLHRWMAHNPRHVMIEIDRVLVEGGGLRALVELGWHTVQLPSLARLRLD